MVLLQVIADVVVVEVFVWAAARDQRVFAERIPKDVTPAAVAHAVDTEPATGFRSTVAGVDRIIIAAVDDSTQHQETDHGDDD